MKQIVYGNLRVQLLNKYIVRADYAKNGTFCDENTFFVPNKTDFTGGVLYTQKEGVICFDEYELYLPQNATSLKGMRLEKAVRKFIHTENSQTAASCRHWIKLRKCSQYRIRLVSSSPKADIPKIEMVNIQ